MCNVKKRLIRAAFWILHPESSAALLVHEPGRVAGTTRGDKGSPTNLKRNSPLIYDNKW